MRDIASGGWGDTGRRWKLSVSGILLPRDDGLPSDGPTPAGGSGWAVWWDACLAARRCTRHSW